MTYMIIVAGGHGTRMGSDIPKQFLKIDGKPILMRTLERFHEYDPEMHLIVVLPKEQQEYWHKLCEEYHFTIPHEIADGGETRFESSKNGLALIPDDAEGLVGFHDGVRPFVSHDTIRRCIEMAEEEYTAIPVVPVTSTLRHIDPRGGGFNVDRSLYREVQTPQVFDITLARQAFNQPDRSQFTDDSSVIESLGCKVSIVEGNRENIKITTPFDLTVAEAIIRKESEE
ncbi:MAG: 2-C-methyl-D-erythritol 4-phosphate cytidylyltransferase [Prevotella sp.]|mgnify:CR=1 FL=1|nr:2-C-methyl-D-erythritol 4-phosphate cytidylyltransferase [Prevotella sp.]